MNVSTARLEEVNPVLPVRDLEKAIHFYVEGLGFEIAFRDRSNPDGYAGVRRDGVELHLQWHSDDEMADSRSLMLRFIVDDPDALYEEFNSRGVVDPKTHVRDTPWGTREFAFFAPDGTGLAFYRDL